MYYSLDLLQKRGGRFGIPWLAATKPKHLTKRDFTSVNILKSCEEVICHITRKEAGRVPPGKSVQKFSLYLSSQLMYGLTFIHGKNTGFLLNDVISFRVKYQPAFSTIDADINLIEHGRLHDVEMPLDGIDLHDWTTLTDVSASQFLDERLTQPAGPSLKRRSAPRSDVEGLHQARNEDITLKEVPLITVNDLPTLYQDDLPPLQAFPVGPEVTVEPLYKNLDEQFTGNDTTLRHAKVLPPTEVTPVKQRPLEDHLMVPPPILSPVEKSMGITPQHMLHGHVMLDPPAMFEEPLGMITVAVPITDGDAQTVVQPDGAQTTLNEPGCSVQDEQAAAQIPGVEQSLDAEQTLGVQPLPVTPKKRTHRERNKVAPLELESFHGESPRKVRRGKRRHLLVDKDIRMPRDDMTKMFENVHDLVMENMIPNPSEISVAELFHLPGMTGLRKRPLLTMFELCLVKPKDFDVTDSDIDNAIWSIPKPVNLMEPSPPLIQEPAPVHFEPPTATTHPAPSCDPARDPSHDPTVETGITDKSMETHRADLSKEDARDKSNQSLASQSLGDSLLLNSSRSFNEDGNTSKRSLRSTGRKRAQNTTINRELEPLEEIPTANQAVVPDVPNMVPDVEVSQVTPEPNLPPLEVTENQDKIPSPPPRGNVSLDLIGLDARPSESHDTTTSNDLDRSSIVDKVEILKAIDYSGSLGESLKFSELCPRESTSRRQAAAAFVNILGLCKEQLISVNQRTPYGDISIKMRDRLRS